MRGTDTRQLLSLQYNGCHFNLMCTLKLYIRHNMAFQLLQMLDAISQSMTLHYWSSTSVRVHIQTMILLMNTPLFRCLHPFAMPHLQFPWSDRGSDKWLIDMVSCRPAMKSHSPITGSHVVNSITVCSSAHSYSLFKNLSSRPSSEASKVRIAVIFANRQYMSLRQHMKK